MKSQRMQIEYRSGCDGCTLLELVQLAWGLVHLHSGSVARVHLAVHSQELARSVRVGVTSAPASSRIRWGVKNFKSTSAAASHVTVALLGIIAASLVTLAESKCLNSAVQVEMKTSMISRMLR